MLCLCVFPNLKAHKVTTKNEKSKVKSEKLFTFVPFFIVSP